MDIQFENITFLFSQVPRDNKVIGSFRAQYETETFRKVVDKYDVFPYYKKPEVFAEWKNEPTVDSLGITHLIMFCHYCIYFEPEKNHKIHVQSDSPFFIIHDAFHALTDIVLHDNVKGCEPFYRLSCQSKCEGEQLLAAYRFMFDNNIPVTDSYLQEVESVYINQNNLPLNILKYKTRLTA